MPFFFWGCMIFHHNCNLCCLLSVHRQTRTSYCCSRWEKRTELWSFLLSFKLHLTGLLHQVQNRDYWTKINIVVLSQTVLCQTTTKARPLRLQQKDREWMEMDVKQLSHTEAGNFLHKSDPKLSLLHNPWQHRRQRKARFRGEKYVNVHFLTITANLWNIFSSITIWEKTEICSA